MEYAIDGPNTALSQELQTRLESLLPSGVKTFAAASEQQVLRIWFGGNPPEGTHVCAIDAPVGCTNETLSDLFRESNLHILVVNGVRPGKMNAMHAVYEKGRSPVYIPSASELSGYLSERIASIQEIP